MEQIMHGQLIADDILAHAGVKGMKWGKRKNPLPTHQYGSKDFKRDTKVFGFRGAERIQRKVNDGKTRGQAVGSEVGKTALITVAAIASSPIGRAAISYGAKTVAQKVGGSRAGVSFKNMQNGTKSITKGYEVVQATMNRSGDWVIR